MGEDFLVPDNKLRVVEEVLAQIAPTFKSILMREIDVDRLKQIIKRNEVRSASQLTDTLISKMLDDYNGSTSLDFIGPVGRPGTSSTATECMEVVPYGDPISSSKTEDEDLSTALSNSVLDQHINAPSTSDKVFEKNEEEKIRDLNKTTGLNNQGNTCWFNALTQMLFSIPKFRSILYHAPPCTWHQMPITNVQPAYSVHAELLLQFRKLFAEMHFSEESYIHVGDLLTTVDRLYTAKGGRSTINLQQDASEMLTLIVDWLGTAISAAIYAHIHPDYSNTSIEDTNMVVSQSTDLSPNSDVAGIAPPGYEEKFAGMPSTSAVQRDPESRANSPVRPGPARDAYGIPKAKSPRQSPPGLEAIDEAMDTSDVPQAGAVVDPAVEQKMEEVPERMNDLVESLKRDTSAIFESTLYTEKYDDVSDGNVAGEANTQTDCPVCFPLPVSYGNLHDGLESFTFGNRSENGITVNTRAMYNELPAVFFVSLNRFHATALSGHKLHDRFTFPREVYMDRYLRKNVDLVMHLRAKQLQYREQLAQVRALLAGVKRYPATNGVDTVDLVEAVRTVMSLTRNVPITGQEDRNCPDKPPNFVRTLHKQVPRLRAEDIDKLKDVSVGLRNTLDHLVEYEKGLNSEMERLKVEIENVYEVEELMKEMYELKAMIIHSGEMNRGHYWTYKLKRSIDGLEEWEKLNDSNTENVDYSRIEQEAFGTGSSDAPSAYLLLYVRKDATWLMSADNETRAESLSNLPSDLQSHVEEKSSEWRRRLADYREGKTSTIVKPQPVYATNQTYVPNEWSLNFAWYRSESDVEADENANPGRMGCLGRRLDSYEIPVSDALEKSNMDAVISSLWSLALYFDRESFLNPKELLDWHLRGTMEGNRGGKEFIEHTLNIPLKDLGADAENDIDYAYNQLIMEYIKEMSRSEHDWRSRFVVFVATQLPRIHTPVIRYLLVRSIAVSNMHVLKHRAEEEIEGYYVQSADKGSSMEKIAETLVHIFHVSVIAAANCRLGLENVKYVMDNDSSAMSSSREKDHAERIYLAMVAARNARQILYSLKQRAGFLEQPNIYFATQINIDLCTVLSTLAALKMVMKVITQQYEDFSNFAVNLSTNEQSLSAETFIGEICIVLSLIRQWKSGIDRRNPQEIADLTGLYDALANKFDFLVSSTEKMTPEKMMYAQQLNAALTDKNANYLDNVTQDMRMPLQPGSGADEWAKLERLSRQLDSPKSKVDSLLTSIDEYITKLLARS